MVNEQPECLEEIDPENPPEQIPDEPISKQECDMNKLRPGHNGYDYFNFSGIVYSGSNGPGRPMIYFYSALK